MKTARTIACAVAVALVTVMSRRVQAIWYIRLAPPDMKTAARRRVSFFACISEPKVQKVGSSIIIGVGSQKSVQPLDGRCVLTRFSAGRAPFLYRLRSKQIGREWLLEKRWRSTKFDHR